jgi:Tfp pilus assembly protein PilF
LYNLKEMSINGTICLARPDMQMLFSSAFSNPTVSPSVRAILYSWYADYLMLREHDRLAAQKALAKSLQLVPTNPSNRLKWAQLIFLEGRRDETAQLLKALRNAPLSSSEKRTAAKLLACLKGDSTQCGKF